MTQPDEANVDQPKKGRKKVVPIRPELEDDDRPVVGLPPGSLDYGRERATELLAADLDVYSREGRLVTVLEREGTRIIHELGIHALGARLSRLARWTVWESRSGSMKPADVPERVVRAVEQWGHWPGVRPLVGVTETPCLRPDGSLLDVPGYDEPTGLLYRPNAEYLPVSAKPSQGEANEALLELLEIYRDFPHATIAAKYVPIAATLSILARPAILGPVPAFVHDASQKRSGKTLQTHCIGITALGHPLAAAPCPTDEAELEKLLAGVALAGDRVLAFDNVRNGAPFGGPSIDRVLTAEDRAKLRILGTNAVPELRWRAVIVVTGNNLTFAGDTGGRVLVSRLETTLEQPEERTTFAHPDLLGYVRSERPRLVRAALMILRGYAAAGYPEQSQKAMGGFRAWSSLVPAAIVWAGGEDVMACRPTVAGEDDSDTRSLRALLAALRVLDPDGQGMTAGTLLARLWPQGWRENAPNWDGLQPTRETLEEVAGGRGGRLPDAPRLGYLLRKLRGRVSAGSRIVSHTGHGGAQRWRVEVIANP